MDAETIAPAVIETKIAEYSPVAAGLADLRHRFGNAAFDLTTTTGDKEARAARLELVRLRTSLEAKRKELKAPALERSRLIDDEAKRITSAILELETPIDQQIRAAEQRKEAERLAKIEAERQRVATIRARIESITSVALRAVGKPAAEVEAKIKLLVGITIGPDYAEFKGEAEAAHADTLSKLRDMHATTLTAEAEAKRLADERAELERLRAEQAERERVERDRLAAEQARIAVDQRAEADRLEALAREQRERLAAEEAAARAEREAADRAAAAERAEQDRIAAEARAAEQRRLDEVRRQHDEARAAAEQRMAPAYYAARNLAGDDQAFEVYLRFAGAPGDKVPLEKVDEYIAALQALKAAEPVNVAGPEHLAPKPAPGLAFNSRGVLSPIPAPRADEPATLKLGAICGRLGFVMTSSFVSVRLGIEPARTEGAAKLYLEGDFARICAALQQHIARVSETVAA